MAVIKFGDEPQSPSKKLKKRNERIWAREWLLQPPLKGASGSILTDLRLPDQEDFRKFL